MPARLHLDELGELFGRELDDEEVETVGGLLAKALGRVPIAGANVTVAGLSLTAERFSGRRHTLATVLVHAATSSGADAGPRRGAGRAREQPERSERSERSRAARA